MRKHHENRSQAMRAAFLALCAIGSIACLTFEGSAAATTGPAAVYVLKAVMTDSKITIVRDPHDAVYVKPGGLVAAFPRGSVITFRVTNKSSKLLLPAVHAVNTLNASPYDHPKKYYTAQRAVAPGKSVDLQINFYFRAPFQLLELYQKKPVGKRVKITIS
jgi:hypothetical protein